MVSIPLSRRASRPSPSCPCRVVPRIPAVLQGSCLPVSLRNRLPVSGELLSPSARDSFAMIKQQANSSRIEHISILPSISLAQRHGSADPRTSRPYGGLGSPGLWLFGIYGAGLLVKVGSHKIRLNLNSCIDGVVVC